MKKVLFAFAALSLVACQAEKNDSSSLAQAESAAALQMSTSASKTLAAGRYLVSVEMTGSCDDRSINLKQTYEYPNSNPSKQATVTLEADGDETDNLARLAVCRPNTKDRGTAVVVLGKAAKIRVKGFGAKLTKIEKIEKTSSVPMVHVNDLFAGDYVVTVSKPLVCTPMSFTAKKHTEFGDFNAETQQMERTVELKVGTPVLDNLIRPMICVASSFDATDSGVVYHQSTGSGTTIVGKDELQIKKIERITKKSSI